MSCFGLSRSSSSSQTENSPCLQKPLTKAALLVISLLFAGGAIASHFTGLGTPGIVGFSVASGLSIVIFIIACLRSPRRISRPTDLENVRNEHLLNNEVRLYDCTQKDISTVFMHVTRQTDSRELDVIGLKRICNGFNGLGESKTWEDKLPVQFLDVDSDPNEDTNNYFVVKDNPSGGVEIFEHRLSTQGVEEVRHWHVDNRVCGDFPCYFFAARLV